MRTGSPQSSRRAAVKGDRGKGPDDLDLAVERWLAALVGSLERASSADDAPKGAQSLQPRAGAGDLTTPATTPQAGALLNTHQNRGPHDHDSEERPAGRGPAADHVPHQQGDGLLQPARAGDADRPRDRRVAAGDRQGAV